MQVGKMFIKKQKSLELGAIQLKLGQFLARKEVTRQA